MLLRCLLTLVAVSFVLAGPAASQQRTRPQDRAHLFREGDIYVGTADSCAGGGGVVAPSVVKFDRVTMTPSLFYQGSIGNFRYDADRDALIGDGSLSGMKQLDARGVVTDIAAVSISQPAPNGRGLVYFSYFGLYALKRDNTFVPVVDLATGVQVDIANGSDEKFVYEPASNALFVLTRYAASCSPFVTTASVRKVSLDATGLFVISISPPVILGCPSQSVSIDAGPTGSLIAHTHMGGGADPDYRAYKIDAFTLAPSIYATWNSNTIPRGFGFGDYSPYLNESICSTALIVPPGGGPGSYYADGIWSFAEGSTNTGTSRYQESSDLCNFGFVRELEVIKY